MTRFRYLPEQTDYVVVDKDFFTADVGLSSIAMSQCTSSQPNWANSEYLHKDIKTFINQECQAILKLITDKLNTNTR